MNPPFATPFHPEDDISSNGHLRQGVLEASIDGVSWGPVCHDFFGINAATIACRQLGFDQVPVAHCGGAACCMPWIWRHFAIMEPDPLSYSRLAPQP